MKQFIDKQLTLHDRAIEKLRGIKQAVQLLRVTPTNSALLSLKAELQLEYFEIMASLTQDFIKDTTNNATEVTNMGIAQSFFENN